MADEIHSCFLRIGGEVGFDRFEITSCFEVLEVDEDGEETE